MPLTGSCDPSGPVAGLFRTQPNTKWQVNLKYSDIIFVIPFFGNLITSVDFVDDKHSV